MSYLMSEKIMDEYNRRKSIEFIAGDGITNKECDGCGLCSKDGICRQIDKQSYLELTKLMRKEAYKNMIIHMRTNAVTIVALQLV